MIRNLNWEKGFGSCCDEGFAWRRMGKIFIAGRIFCGNFRFLCLVFGYKSYGF